MSYHHWFEDICIISSLLYKASASRAASSAILHILYPTLDFPDEPSDLQSIPQLLDELMNR